MDVCTIIAKNYLAHARVLARSFAEHHPDGRVWTLVIDEFDGYIDAGGEPFEVLTPGDIGCEPFRHMALRYSVLELSTAVKPWLLRHLMGRTGRPITYLDPDIKVYGSLERLDQLAEQHGTVLIPHNRDPIPADGRMPSQVDIMIAGVYNLGYVSLAPSAEIDRLLDWWSDRLERDCRVDPIWGYFVDQRWFDLAPGFLSDVAIVRDPQYNVAYWNLHNRRLDSADGVYQVDGRPLGFFHFSGFDPRHPLVLSRHQNRIDVTANPVLERLLAEYAEEVMAEGHAVSREWSYTYGRLANGLDADQTLRALYERFLDEHEPGAGVVLSPFTPQGAKVFTEWLREQAPGAPAGINRILAHIYETRSDVRAAYPELGPGGSGLMEWVEEYGKYEIPLLAHAMGEEPRPVKAPSIPETDARPAPTGPPGPVSPLHDEAWGVNVVGYFRSELGTGEAARQVVAALDAQQIPVLPIHGQTVPLNRQGHSYETADPEDAAFPVNLICMNADMLPEFAGQVGAEFFADRYTIGLWFWEVSRFPDRWLDSFGLLEEVWAPTAHIASALEPVATVPVHAIRVPVAPGRPAERSRDELGLPEDRFVFLFSFDYLSVFRRKNPLAVIDAFTRAFAPGEGAALIIKCINSERDPASHAELCSAAATHPDVEVMDRYMSPAENLALTSLADSYVSLHRAEGLGLVMAEAMWFGKPVIATGYSGNLDFMNSENSLLVEHTLVPIGPDAPPYPPEGVWAEPSVDHAASLMRRVFDEPEFARELGSRAASEIRRTHSPEAAGQIMHRRLEVIRATGDARPPGVFPPERPSAASALGQQVRSSLSSARGPRGAARRLLRRSVLRAIRPFTTHQEAVNYEMLRTIEELRDAVSDARRAGARDRARLLAELRRYDQLPDTVGAQDRTIAELRRRLGELERGSSHNLEPVQGTSAE